MRNESRARLFSFFAAFTFSCSALLSAQTPFDSVRLRSTGLASVAATPLVLGLLRDLETTPYQAALGTIRFTNTETKQSVSLAPWRLISGAERCNDLCQVTLGLSTTKAFSSLTLGWTYDRAAPHRGRLQSILRGIERGSDPIPAIDEARIAALPSADAKLAAREEYFRTTLAGRLYGEAYDEFAKGAWSVGLSANYQLFPALNAVSIDADGNGKIDEAYSTRGYGALVTFAYAWSLRSSVQLGAGMSSNRASAEEAKPLRRSPSAFVTGRRLLHVLDPKYRSKPSWFEDMFVPALYGTLGIEWQECQAVAADCDSLTKRSLVVTPAVEIRLAKETQFRIGVPVSWFRRGAKNRTELTPTFQFGLLLGGAP